MAQRYALIIGISSYHRSVGNLTKPATDAQAVAQCLRHHGGFEVTLHTETLTLEALRQALKRFLLDQAKGNDALIYFTGHGILSESTTGYRETFLAASDTEIIRQAGKPMEPLYILPFGELNSLIQQSNLSSLVLLLDCCHSGDMLERDPVERALSAFNSTQRNYCFITACRSFEESRAKRSEQHSLFTGALLEALAAPSRPEDGSTITSGLLFYRLSQSLKGSGQEALHLGWGNDIAIATYPPVKSADSAPKLNLHNPYIGLASFDAATAQYFHGREQSVRALQARLLNCRVLTVFGPSGCGKSSLIKAGLLPALQCDPIFDGSTWEAKVITPTAQPLTVLRDLLNQPPKPFVLFIDQFEELFTLCEDEAEQRDFIRLIGESVSRMDHLKRLIIAIRGDFLDRCAKIPESAALINRENELTTYMVTHLSNSEMAAAIERPAAQHEVTFQVGLVPQMIADVGNEPGALPLLQYALTKLWEVCIKPDMAVLTEAGYTQIGGVQGALQQRADQLYRNLHPDDQAFVQQLLIELVQLGEGQEVTRRKASWEKLRETRSPAQLSRIIEQLTKERLIVTDEKTVEVAHEALLSQWSLLKNWIDENRENIRLSRHLESDCHEWQEKNQSEDYLLSTGRLAAIQEWVEKAQPKLTHTETDFLNQSIEKRDRDRQSEIRLYRRVAIGGVAAALCITAVATLAGMQWRIADKGQIEALATSSKATFNLNRNSFDALIEALQAAELLQQSTWFKNDPELQTKVMESLAQATYWVREKNRLEGHNNYVYGIAFSPDGQLIATAGYDKVAKLWSVDGKELLTLQGHEQGVTDVSFSPDGKLIATASEDKTAKLWSRDGKNQATLKGHTGSIWSVSFSTDGKLIATASGDKTVKLWSSTGQDRGIVLKGHDGVVYKAVFDADGTIATASEDKTARLWDQNGKLIRVYKGHTGTVYSVRFIDQQTIATASADKTAILWNRQTGKPIHVLKGHTDGVRDIALSKNSQLIATAGDDDVVKLWSRDGILLETLQGHNSRVQSVNFSPDGKFLASVSNDKTARLWQIQPPIRLLGKFDSPVYQVSISQDGKTFTALSQDGAKVWSRNGESLASWQDNLPIYAVSLSPDGKIVATGSGKQIKLWNSNGQLRQVLGKHDGLVLNTSFSKDGQVIATTGVDAIVKFWSRDGKPLAALKAHDQPIYKVQFSPDGEVFATASLGGSVKLWNRERKLLHTLEGHKAAVYDVSFSPNGQILATASEDNTVKVWSREGKLLHTLQGHQAGVGGVSFSPDGKIATGSDDRTVKLWTKDGKLLTTLVGHREPVNSARFSPDGKALITASSDGTVLLWDVNDLTLEGLIQRGCNWMHDHINSNQKSLKQVCRSFRK
ncbi:caspase family protein [Phormidium sp. CLA17]|uniref:nSTAND1 domain-containing NTPase n=1 Tax=Leptolyngbya sp. Cla-17 TaxID=2803751 RepID=UPI0014916522|nr:caspase family protein [Leptolyngbya sp. Cla-17]MBM0743066.1 caspase family protein [Leptolyngbya sp. Cla-17]